MLNRTRFLNLLFIAGMLAVLGVSAFADTIKMKDGSIIKGKIIEFKDQSFVIVIGDDAKGRKRQITVYTDEIDSISFDQANTTVATITEPVKPPVVVVPRATPTPVPTPQPTPMPTPVVEKPRYEPPVVSAPIKTGSKGVYVAVSNNVKVLADNTANGWTNSGYVVRRGQRIRVTARGNISLGSGRYAKPEGDSSFTDNDKLLKQNPTGALVAVIGDDNDEFIFIGSTMEFVAQRDGTLFLGINESNLDDNSGAFDVTVEAEIDN
jgi:hypothetical protein